MRSTHDRFLIKVSFTQAQEAAPELEVGPTRVRGQSNAAAGDFWQFDVMGLTPSTPYKLALTSSAGRPLCEPWQLSTFPAPDSMPEKLRLMIYTCGGGHDALSEGLPDGQISFLPSALRRRLLQRGLSFKPDALIANGDQIYWDLRAPLSIKRVPEALRVKIAGTFDRSLPVFGTLRYGKLVEILLYDIRRTQTLAGPSAVFVDGTVEAWLKSRMTDREMIHVVNIPSNPPGWSAGKWGEWYPDILSKDGKLTTDVPKPYWQSGWLKQHDRLMAEIAAMPGRIPLVVSGDLHAIAEGRMMRCGGLDFSRKPVNVILSGPLGTGDRGWPSAFRGIGASPPTHLTMEEDLKPIEENGFILADFTAESITVRYFRFNYHKQSPDMIDTLEPFRVTELKRS